MFDYNAGSLTWNLDIPTAKFDAKLAASKVGVTSLAKSFQNGESVIGKSFSRLSRGASSFYGKLSGASKQVVGDLGRLAGRVASVGWIGLEAGAVAATGAVIALGVKGIKSASELQSLQISMNGLTHSMNLGKKAMAGAYKYAQKAPFQLPDVAATTKSLIAYGMSAKGAVGSLETLGNVSITTGVPLQALGGIFGRVSAQGHLMGQDISQLTENGVAILPALQKQLGLTADQVQSMASNGQISFGMFNKAMKSMVDPTILDQLTNTLPRQIDRLGGSTRMLSNAFVGVGVDAKSGFKAATDGLYQTTVNAVRSVADILRDPSVTKAAGEMGKTVAIALSAVPNFIKDHKRDIAGFFNGLAGFFHDINKTAKTEGIRKALDNVAESLSGAVKHLDIASIFGTIVTQLGSVNYASYSTQITKIFLGLFTSIDYGTLATGVVSTLIVAVPQIIDGIVNGFIDTAFHHPLDLLKFILAIGFIPAKFIGVLAKALSEIPVMGPIASFLLTSIKSVTDLALSPVKSLLGKLGGGMLSGIRTGLGNLGGFLNNTLLQPVLRFFVPAGKWLLSGGGKIVSGLTSGIRNMGGAAWNAIKSVADKIGQAFKGAGNWLYGVGRAVVDGLVRGMKSVIDSVGNTVGNIAHSAVDKIKNLLGIHSPSRVFAGFGANIVQGLVNGIDNSRRFVGGAMTRLGNQASLDTTMNLGTSSSGSGAVVNGSLPAPSSTISQPAPQPVIVHLHMDGIMTRSRADMRSITKDMIESVNEELRARRAPEIGNGALNGRSAA